MQFLDVLHCTYLHLSIAYNTIVIVMTVAFFTAIVDKKNTIVFYFTPFRMRPNELPMMAPIILIIQESLKIRSYCFYFLNNVQPTEHFRSQISRWQVPGCTAFCAETFRNFGVSSPILHRPHSFIRAHLPIFSLVIIYPNISDCRTQIGIYT